MRLNAEAKAAGKPAPAINEEEPIHPLYAYLYVADREEGLILVNAATLLDGDPRNNFLKRAPSRSIPDGALTGANNITIAGNFAYDHDRRASWSIVDLSTPLQPKIATRIPFDEPRAVAVQFLYAFVVDADWNERRRYSRSLQTKGEARRVEAASVPLGHAHDIYVARTYAYVANGEEGIAIIDVEQPEQPQPRSDIQRRGRDQRHALGSRSR